MQTAVILEQKDYDLIMNRIRSLERRLEQAEQHSLEWVTVDQAKRLLNCCKNTVYAMCAANKIVKKQDGRKIGISLKSIREYNERHTV